MNEGKLFGDSRFFGLLSFALAILAIELFNPSRSINKFLLARVKRVTIGTNINIHIFYRRMNLNLISTCTPDFGFKVIWMYTCLHVSQSLLNFMSS